MSNRTTTVFRPSPFTGLWIHTIYSSPVQPKNGCTPCVNASSRTPESASPLHPPNGYGILPVPQVLLGYDLEDNLKNLIISALNGNANPAANIRILDQTSPSKKENNRSNMIHCIQPLIWNDTKLHFNTRMWSVCVWIHRFIHQQPTAKHPKFSFSLSKPSLIIVGLFQLFGGISKILFYVYFNY